MKMKYLIKKFIFFILIFCFKCFPQDNNEIIINLFNSLPNNNRIVPNSHSKIYINQSPFLAISRSSSFYIPKSIITDENLLCLAIIPSYDPYIFHLNKDETIMQETLLNNEHFDQYSSNAINLIINGLLPSNALYRDNLKIGTTINRDIASFNEYSFNINIWTLPRIVGNNFYLWILGDNILTHCINLNINRDFINSNNRVYTIRNSINLDELLDLKKNRCNLEIQLMNNIRNVEVTINSEQTHIINNDRFFINGITVPENRLINLKCKYKLFNLKKDISHLIPNVENFSIPIDFTNEKTTIKFFLASTNGKSISNFDLKFNNNNIQFKKVENHFEAIVYPNFSSNNLIELKFNDFFENSNFRIPLENFFYDGQSIVNKIELKNKVYIRNLVFEQEQNEIEKDIIGLHILSEKENEFSTYETQKINENNFRLVLMQNKNSEYQFIINSLNHEKENVIFRIDENSPINETMTINLKPLIRKVKLNFSSDFPEGFKIFNEMDSLLINSSDQKKRIFEINEGIYNLKFVFDKYNDIYKSINFTNISEYTISPESINLRKIYKSIPLIISTNFKSSNIINIQYDINNKEKIIHKKSNEAFTIDSLEVGKYDFIISDLNNIYEQSNFTELINKDTTLSTTIKIIDLKRKELNLNVSIAPRNKYFIELELKEKYTDGHESKTLKYKSETNVFGECTLTNICYGEYKYIVKDVNNNIELSGEIVINDIFKNEFLNIKIIPPQLNLIADLNYLSQTSSSNEPNLPGSVFTTTGTGELYFEPYGLLKTYCKLHAYSFGASVTGYLDLSPLNSLNGYLHSYDAFLNLHFYKFLNFGLNINVPDRSSLLYYNNYTNYNYYFSRDNIKFYQLLLEPFVVLLTKNYDKSLNEALNLSNGDDYYSKIGLKTKFYNLMFSIAYNFGYNLENENNKEYNDSFSEFELTYTRFDINASIKYIDDFTQAKVPLPLFSPFIFTLQKDISLDFNIK
ncbi:MAG TPA: hypothetical protein PLP19_21980 [bacterium]|nr:hypothetical protein [bacterium]HPN46169.1 hypothetical protein [bacterium]